MKQILISIGVLVAIGGGAAWFLIPDGPPEEGRFHPDYTRVFNGFQEATSAAVGGNGVSSVQPDSECKQLEEHSWRCYRRWAPVGNPQAAEMLQADVDVYDDRVVVGEISRTPDTGSSK